MEARASLAMLATISMLICCFLCPSNVAAQYRAQTTNFTVVGPDSQLTQIVAREAERYRKELAMEWLGRELPTWREKCPIEIELSRYAGGETSFAFVDGGNSEPMYWKMKISGPADRLVDAVLPHEVTHTIFATHFGRPLPRWADEGACTTVEHETERAKNHRMLMQFLTAKPSRGIPFNRMFTMREYPHDILPLYAQGFSLAKFLIMKKGKRHFVNYIGAGMNAQQSSRDTGAWDRITGQYYGFENLSELQLTWLKWVKDGSRPIAPVAESEIVSAPPVPIEVARSDVAVGVPSTPIAAASFAEHQAAKSKIGSGWYARQARLPENVQTTTANRETIWR
jgi:hypothetical protein